LNQQGRIHESKGTKPHPHTVYKEGHVKDIDKTDK